MIAGDRARFAYVTFALSLVHGLMAGSDTGSLWALAFYAAALQWEDLELDGARPTIIIQHSADTRKQTRVSTTKTGEERRVRIGPRMVEVLRRHRAHQLEERMKASSWEDLGLVFLFLERPGSDSTWYSAQAARAVGTDQRV